MGAGMAPGMAAQLMMQAAAAAAAYAAQQRAARMQAQAAKRNAETARLAAQDAKERGEVEEYRHRQRVSALIGRQRALIGASGFTVDEGVALDIVADAATLGELDALMIRNNAARSAWGFQEQSAGFSFEAHMARIQQTWGAGATLLGGAASTYGAYRGMQPTTTTPTTGGGGAGLRPRFQGYDYGP